MKKIKIFFKNLCKEICGLNKIDFLKISVLFPIFLLPGGLFLVLLIVKYSKKVFGIDMTLTKQFSLKGLAS